MVAKKGSSAGAQLAALLQSKGKLALDKAKLGMQIPTQHDIEAQSYAKSAEGIDNTSTAGALLKGAIEGLSLGAKSKAAAAKEAKLLEQEAVIKDLESWHEKAIAAEQKAIAGARAKEEMLPALMGYIRSAPTLGADGRWRTAQNVVSGYNTRAGTNFQLVSIDAMNPTLWTLKDGDSGDVQAMDVPAMMAPDMPQINEELGSMYPTYQREQGREDQKVAIQQAHLGISQSHESREQQKFNVEQSTNPAEKKYQEVEASEQAKKNIEYVEQTREAGEKAVPLLRTAQALKGMVKGGKVIMGAGIVNDLLRDHQSIGNIFAKKGLTETQKYDAAMREFIGHVNNSGIRIANKEEFMEGILKKLPDVSKNPEAALDIINRIERELKNKVQAAHKVESRVSRNQGHVPRDIRSQTTQSVEVIAPDGRRALIPADQVQEAAKKGFRVNASS